MKTGKKANGKKRVGRNVLLGILCFVLLMIILIALIVMTMMNKITRADEDAQYVAPEDEYFDTDAEPGDDANVVDPEDVEWDETELIEGDVLNFMLIGQDRREGEGRARSDSMILCSINRDEHRIYLVSFMRDLYVQIPHYSDNRMNAAYAFGGMPLLDETMKVNFGVEVEGNVEVDFEGFTEIIDLLGGVNVHLSSAEAEWINVGEKEDTYLLDGEHALDYARIRYLDSDFGRTNRQRKILSAVFEALKTTGVTNAINVINSALPYVTTDMTNAEIIKYATELLPLLTDFELETGNIPVEGGYYDAVIRGMMVLVPDLETNRSALEDYICPTAD